MRIAETEFARLRSLADARDRRRAEQQQAAEECRARAGWGWGWQAKVLRAGGDRDNPPSVCTRYPLPASATHQTCGKLAGKTRQNVRALARASRRGEAFNPHVHSNLIINWNCFQLLITSWLIILEHADVTRHVQTDALVSGLNMSMIKLHVTCTRERYGEFMVCWYHRESGPP